MGNQHTEKTNMQTRKIPSPFHLFPLAAAAIFLFPGAHCASASSVVNTKHNLSVTGPGEIHSTSETRICIFCHTPHHASDITPLWSRPLNTSVYDLYASTTLNVEPGQPTGYSRLCLSCHDGTIALGLLHGAAAPIPFTGSLMGRPSNLDTDLSNDHPISFAYTSQLAAANGELKLPTDLPSVIKLEDGLNLQCTSCHNPHSDPYGKFLVMDNSASQLCTACHDKTGWTGSSHKNVTVAEVTGCLNCHDTHSAGGAQRLLKTAAEEGTCLNCHKAGSGVAGAVDIQTTIEKFSHHPVDDATSVHDPVEVLPLAADKVHVECADCHNPHQLNDDTAEAPLINGRLKGVKGVLMANGEVTSGYAENEYEVCFRCHGVSEKFFILDPGTVRRQIEEGDKRLCFHPDNPSYHPVAALSKATSPSLITPSTSRIYCTDCHNSDASVKAKVGNTGANGPHGSANEPLLIARYDTGSPPQSYTTDKYALCFRCHDVAKVMNASVSTFPLHTEHVMDSGVPCSVCHDPHGIPWVAGGNTTNNAHLINFDSFVVPTGTYDSVARTCTVSCHQLIPKSY